MLSVIVKGPETAATFAANNRGIFVENAESYGSDTILYVKSDHESKVVAWFCESGVAPFPIGTCLFYKAVNLAGVEVN